MSDGRAVAAALDLGHWDGEVSPHCDNHSVQTRLCITEQGKAVPDGEIELSGESLGRALQMVVVGRDDPAARR